VADLVGVQGGQTGVAQRADDDSFRSLSFITRTYSAAWRIESRLAASNLLLSRSKKETLFTGVHLINCDFHAPRFMAYPFRWKKKAMNQKPLWLLTLLLLAASAFAEAQQPKKVPRIGYLSADSGPPPRR